MKQILKEWRGYLAEEEKPKVNIFLDMDGVLVDFPSALKIYIKSVYNTDPAETHRDSKSARKALRNLQSLQLDEEGIEALYDRSEEKFKSGEAYLPKEKIMSDYVLKSLFGNERLWLAMNKLIGADELVNIVFQLADNVFILSAHVDDTSKLAKKKWIAHHYPNHQFKGVEIERDKGARLQALIRTDVISGDDLNILIDDRRSFLQSFVGAGGTGIQYNSESPEIAIEELKAVVGD